LLLPEYHGISLARAVVFASLKLPFSIYFLITVPSPGPKCMNRGGRFLAPEFLIEGYMASLPPLVPACFLYRTNCKVSQHRFWRMYGKRESKGAADLVGHQMPQEEGRGGGSKGYLENGGKLVAYHFICPSIASLTGDLLFNLVVDPTQRLLVSHSQDPT